MLYSGIHGIQQNGIHCISIIEAENSNMHSIFYYTIHTKQSTKRKTTNCQILMFYMYGAAQKLVLPDQHVLFSIKLEKPNI